MPKKVKESHLYKKVIEEARIQYALKAIKKGMSVRYASEKYRIPRYTLQSRLNDMFVKTTGGPAPVLGTKIVKKTRGPLLCKNAEIDIVNWIVDCSKRGFPRRIENVLASIKYYLDKNEIKNPFVNNKPGYPWYKHFLRKHNIVFDKFSERVICANSYGGGESEIRKWFNEIHSYLSTNNYLDILNDPKRIFNFDENSFMVFSKLAQGSENIYEIDKDLYLTVLFAFSATGMTTPPMLIYPLEISDEVAHSLPDDWSIGTTPKGLMNVELFADYFKNIFHPYLMKENIVFPVILFIDGYTNNVPMEISKICSELGIILLCLYHNVTKILQPLDLAILHPLKNLWKNCVFYWKLKNPSQNLSIMKIPFILKNIIEIFKNDSEAIKDCFKACGLYPWDPNTINYSRCLAPDNQIIASNTNLSDNQSSNQIIASNTNLSYQIFAELVGKELLTELQCYNSKERFKKKSKEFLVLYNLLVIFRIISNDISNKQTSSSETQLNSNTECVRLLSKDDDVLIEDEVDDNILDLYKFLGIPMEISNENNSKFKEIEKMPVFLESNEELLPVSSIETSTIPLQQVWETDVIDLNNKENYLNFEVLDFTDITESQ